MTKLHRYAISSDPMTCARASRIVSAALGFETKIYKHRGLPTFYFWNEYAGAYYTSTLTGHLHGYTPDAIVREIEEAHGAYLFDALGLDYPPARPRNVETVDVLGTEYTMKPADAADALVQHIETSIFEALDDNDLGNAISGDGEPMQAIPADETGLVAVMVGTRRFAVRVFEIFEVAR